MLRVVPFAHRGLHFPTGVKGERARLGRMFEHREMSGAVLRLLDKNNPTPVEMELKKVISAFTQLQEDRYRAVIEFAARSLDKPPAYTS